MRNRKNVLFIAIFAVLAAAVSLQAVFNYHNSIPVSFVENDRNKETAELQKRCIKDMNLEDEYSVEDISSFSIFYGDVTADEAPDMVVVIKLDNATFVSVYCKDEDKYKYICRLGPFCDVESVEFRYMENLSKNAVFLREKVNQSLGCFESDEFIRGYAFIDDILTPVISITADIETYWNDNFSSESSENKWEKITQKSEVKWISGDCPEIILTKEQNLFCAKGNSSERINSDEDFINVDSRIITETYTWSDKWEKFILGEKVFIPTGETVAVLEDMSSLPYSLAGLDSSRSRILFENGDISVVNNKDLK